MPRNGGATPESARAPRRCGGAGGMRKHLPLPEVALNGPAPGAAAEIEADDARIGQLFARIGLFQLEYRARAPALRMLPRHEGIGEMPVQ